MPFMKGVISNPKGKPPTYKLPRKYNRRYARAKAQAKFRGEGWTFTDKSWYKLWQDSGHIKRIGKQADCYCMARKNLQKPWGPHNCLIVERRKHLMATTTERHQFNSEIEQNR